MGIRQLLNSSRNATICIVLLLAVAAVLAGRQMMQANGPKPPSGQAFYSIDDGKTWFRDAADKATGFQKDGKPAYRVAVWKCTQCGAEFVSHLERVNPKAETRINTGAAPASAVAVARGQEMEVKQPGAPESAWVKAITEAGIKITAPQCPKGHNDCEPVAP